MYWAAGRYRATEHFPLFKKTVANAANIYRVVKVFKLCIPGLSNKEVEEPCSRIYACTSAHESVRRVKHSDFRLAAEAL